MLLGLTARAQAGDLGDPSLKDPIPDNLTLRGVTLYGVIDLDYAYQTHGVPLGASFYPGLEYNISGSKNANKPISSLAESGLEQSKLGLKIEEPIGSGWVAIGKLEAGFDPLSGELADAMGLPYAFSLIGYSGGAAAGIGNTETGRWDNSAKYTYHWAYG